MHKRRIFEIAEAFRRRGKLVAAGGPFATLCPEELRGRVDVLFVGEAEYTWPQFVRDYENGAWQPEYRQDEKPSMLDSPLPRFDLLKVRRYRSMAIQFARGCPYSCEFCDIIVMYGRRPRTKSVAQVLAEVEAIHALGVENIFVVDDNFIGNKKDAKALLAALGDWQRAPRLSPRVHDRGQPQRRPGRRAPGPHEAGPLHHDLRGHRVPADGEPAKSRTSRRTRGRTSSPPSTGSRPPASR